MPASSRTKVLQRIQQTKSFLCVGLDTDPLRLPVHLNKQEDPVFAFNKAIIEATLPYTVAYKFNIAFYEAQGQKGWESLAKTLECIPKEVLTIADAKRGDIGNTSNLYARAFFETYSFDSITVAPYMGADSVLPFLQYPGKCVFLLALTSNPGAQDFQYLPVGEDEVLYRKVTKTALEWEQQGQSQLGFVVGATRPEQIAEIRAMAPEAMLLIPGVGAQGGDLHAACRNGKNAAGGMLINSSRGIIYASAGEDFAEVAGKKAAALQEQMAAYAEEL